MYGLGRFVAKYGMKILKGAGLVATAMTYSSDAAELTSDELTAKRFEEFKRTGKFHFREYQKEDLSGGKKLFGREAGMAAMASGKYVEQDLDPKEAFSKLSKELGPERAALLYQAMGLGNMPIGSGGTTAGQGAIEGATGALADVTAAADAAAKAKQFADALSPKAVQAFNSALEQSAGFLSDLATGGGLLNRGTAPGQPNPSAGGR